MLAKLVLEANHVVSLESLVDAVWEDSPPTTARSQVQICVSLLRRAMSALGVTRDPIVTHPSGYLLRLDRCALDVRLFRQGADEARKQAATGEVERARATMIRAIGLWQGEAFSGVDSPVVQAGAARLEEERLQALEALTDWDLELGRHERVIGVLRERVAQHPLRERIRGQLMEALERAGRHAEALETYRAGREVIAQELGLAPSDHLQELEARIRRGAPLTSALRCPAVRMPAGRQIAELSSPISAAPQVSHPFVARPDAVNVVATALAAVNGRVVSVVGIPGAGKSALAAHVANDLADKCFPDGVLYAHLGAADTGQVLAGFLRTLGFGGERVPPDERAKLFQDVTRERGVLVMLDDVREHSAVRLLTPTGRGCATLVTSRSSPRAPLGEVLEIGVFSPAEAMRCVAMLAGDHRVAADRQAVRRAVDAVGLLPAAVRSVGERLRDSEPGTASQLASRLSDRRLVLDELSYGQIDVRAGLRTAYLGLSSEAQRLLRLMSDLGTEMFSDRTATAASGLPGGRVGEVVAELRDAGLVRSVPTGHRLHLLTRVFGVERMRAEEPHLSGMLTWIA